MIPFPKDSTESICRHLLKEDDVHDEVMPCCGGDAEIDNLLIQESQMYVASREECESDKMIDVLFLQASQEVENQLVKFQVKSSPS